jgi:hypothetical protein
VILFVGLVYIIIIFLLCCIYYLQDKDCASIIMWYNFLPARTEPEKVSDIPETKGRSFDSLTQLSGMDVRKSAPHKQRPNLP